MSVGKLVRSSQRGSVISYDEKNNEEWNCWPVFDCVCSDRCTNDLTVEFGEVQIYHANLIHLVKRVVR